MNPNLVKITTDYLTPLIRLPFESELLSETHILKDIFDIVQFNSKYLRSIYNYDTCFVNKKWIIIRQDFKWGIKNVER